VYCIEKEFSFSAAHYLERLPPEHPCARIHGHNYRVILRLAASSVDRIGFVRDYHDLDSVKKLLDLTLDHRILNEVWPEMNPTAENIAKRLFDEFRTYFPELVELGVSETDKTWAWYE
jgi:6-pyruvoyltetrahydropterin/6-carboxytetrahydropterin synthase